MIDRRRKKLINEGGEKRYMRIKRNENGITLIALIITIIILVILAAVSIRAVTNMGIVGHAINGTQQYAEQAKAENEMLGQTATKLEDAVAKVKEIQGGSNNNTGNTETEALDLLKDYVLGKADSNGVRPGKKLWGNLYNNGFQTQSDSITDTKALPVYLNELWGDYKNGELQTGYYYIRYGNAAYKIELAYDNDEDEATTTNVVKVYEPDSNSRVGRIVQYKAKASDETATDWLVLYDNGTTLDIMSLAEMGSYTLGSRDTNATGADALAKAMDSYENAVSRLNAYCGTLVTNIDASKGEKVRSIGTQFDIADTTAKYSSTFLENNPTSSAGTYNGVGLTGDMNGEQDVVRMSYYAGTAAPYNTTFGYAATTNPYWLASRCVNEGPDDVRFSVRFVDGGNAEDNSDLWGVVSAEARIGSCAFAVRPVVRVAVGNVSGL